MNTSCAPLPDEYPAGAEHGPPSMYIIWMNSSMVLLCRWANLMQVLFIICSIVFPTVCNINNVFRYISLFFIMFHQYLVVASKGTIQFMSNHGRIRPRRYIDAVNSMRKTMVSIILFYRQGITFVYLSVPGTRCPQLQPTSRTITSCLKMHKWTRLLIANSLRRL